MESPDREIQGSQPTSYMSVILVLKFSLPLKRWCVMTRTCYTAVLVLGVLVCGTQRPGATKKISYAITELAPWVSSNRSAAYNINELGQVVGDAFVDETTHACIWERVGGQWTIRELGASAYYVTSDGQQHQRIREVAGIGHGTTDKAFFYGESGLIELVPGEYGSSWALDINYFGDVCGVSDGQVLCGQACLWERDGRNTWVFADLGVCDRLLSVGGT